MDEKQNDKREVLKTIRCPNEKCGRGINLNKGDFEIEVDPADQTYCVSHSIICPWPGCGAEFWIAWNEIIWVRRPR